jgi:multiple sugar transport system permease protein
MRNKQNILVHLVLVLVGIIFIIPFIWMASTSLKDNIEVYTRPLAIIPEKLRFDNYQQAFELVPFGRFYINTIILTTGRVIGQVILASLAGYSFARLRFPGRNFLFVLVLGIMMVPYMVTIIPRFMILLRLNWLDTYWGLIIPGLADAFGVFLLRQFYLSFPQDLIDAAEMDGCNPLQTFMRVAFPLARPTLAAYAFLVIMWSWNDFLWPLIVVSSTKMLTISLGIQLFQNQYTKNLAVMMAAATISIFPIMVVFILAQKYIIEGITMSGLKL